MAESEYDWLCPWCSKVADLPLNFPVISDSKLCKCGAIGLGAPPWDMDEIVDDAINIFGPIPQGYMTPFDGDRIAGLRQIGVEVAGPEAIERTRNTERRVLWFRRKPA